VTLNKVIPNRKLNLEQGVMAHKFCTRPASYWPRFSFFQKILLANEYYYVYSRSKERERAHFVLIKAPETDPLHTGMGVPE